MRSNQHLDDWTPSYQTRLLRRGLSAIGLGRCLYRLVPMHFPDRSTVLLQRRFFPGKRPTQPPKVRPESERRSD